MSKQVSEQCFGEPRKNLGGRLLGVLITVLPFRLLKSSRFFLVCLSFRFLVNCVIDP
jgi:hypothetical protein